MTSILAASHAVSDARQRSELYRQWHAAHHMGMTHPTFFQESGLRLSGPADRIRAAFSKATAEGRTLTSVTQEHARLFDPFEGALIELGEESGALEQSLRLLADWFVRQHKLLLAISKQQTYPIFLLLAAAVIGPLPLLFKQQERAYFWIAGLGVAAWWFMGGTIITMVSRNSAMRLRFAQARLLRALTTAQEAGLPLDRTIDLAVRACANDALASHVARIPEKRRRSQTLAQTFGGCPVVTPAMLGVMKVAEETGDYRTSLGRMAELYEDGFK